MLSRITKRVALFSLLLLIFSPLTIQSQQTCSYGLVCSSLSTTLTTAVTGTAFAVPSNYAAMITWQVVADGSALSVNLQGSQDNSTWFTIDTQTTATGGIKNYGFSSLKFVRINAVSRTGGTSTTGTITISRGFITSGSTNLSSTVMTGNLLFAPTGTYTIGTSTSVGAPLDIFASNTITTGGTFFGGGNIWASSSGAFGWSSGAKSRIKSPSDGVISLLNTAETDFSRLQFGGTTSSFPAIRRTGASLYFRLADDSGAASIVAGNATFDRIIQVGIAFASLGSPSDGQTVYCSDCLYNSNPCSGASTGAIAKRIAGAWRCD